MRGRGGLDQQAHIGRAGCRHLRAAYSPGPRTVRLLMQQTVQQQPSVPFAASASCRGNHPGHDGRCRGADVRRCEFRPAASGAERDNRSKPGFMWRIGPTYLGVRAGGGVAKSWSQRLRINGKAVQPGLGSVSHRDASRGHAIRRLRTRGRSPREASRATARVSAEGLTETGTNAYGMVRLQRGRRRLSMGLTVPAGAGKTTLCAAIAAAVAEPPLRARPG